MLQGAHQVRVYVPSTLNVFSSVISSDTSATILGVLMVVFRAQPTLAAMAFAQL